METPSTDSQPKPAQDRSRARRRWRRRLRGIALNLVVLTALFGLMEVYFRYIHTPSTELAGFIFVHEMSNERWDYLLDGETDPRLIESLKDERIPTRHPNTDVVEKPEPNRPPYDRLRRSYHVITNSDGFRDREFVRDKPAGSERIIVLGDSIAYGKGLPTESRFGDVLKETLPAHVELLNLGHPACGTVCMVQYLEEFLVLKPDLVIVQPSGNDVDTTMGRAAMQSRGGILSNIVRWALRSRAIQALGYLLFADAGSSQIDASVDATGEYYAEDLERLFRVCREHGAKVVVLSLPGANDAWYGEHVSAACGEHPDVCLGAFRIDLAHPERWVPTWANEPEATATKPPDWLVETAEMMDMDPEVLAELFPLRQFFFDIVHPNHLAHRIAGRQLEAFLSSNWSGWQARPETTP